MLFDPQTEAGYQIQLVSALEAPHCEWDVAPLAT